MNASRRAPAALTSLTLGGTALLLAACTSVQPSSSEPPSSPPPSSGSPATVPADYPAGHIHGMSVDPATSRVLLATHDGLFDVSRSPAEQVGPSIDLMGLTTSTDGTLYASGHPGPGTDLPDPVGLITSTDQGNTWTPVARQGETDFHALAVAGTNLVGYEGRILTSTEGHRWTVTAEDIPAHSLAGAGSGTVLATTEEGLRRSEDGGATWAAVPDAPLLVLTAFAGTTAVGVTPGGLVHTSADEGLTWQERGAVDGEPAAIAAVRDDDGTTGIWVATADGVQVSRDDGATFAPLRAS